MKKFPVSTRRVASGFVALLLWLVLLMAAEAEMILGEVYRPQGPVAKSEGKPETRVWVEAIFIETTEKALDNVESSLECPEHYEEGEATLSPWHLHSLDRSGGIIVGLSSVVTRSGEEGVSEPPDEVTWESTGADGSKQVQKSRVGPFLRVIPTVLPDGRIQMALVTGMVVPSHGETDAEERPVGPRLERWTRATTLTIKPGTSFILKERRSRPFCRTEDAVVKGEGLEVPTVPYREHIPVIQEHRRRLARIIPEVKFEDAKLVEVVQFFSKATEDNIVIDPSVFTGYRGPLGLFDETLLPSGVLIPPTPEPGITLNLKDVPAKVLLEAILKHKNLRYFISFQCIVIVPADYVPPDVKEQDRVLLTIISAGIAGAN